MSQYKVQLYRCKINGITKIYSGSELIQVANKITSGSYSDVETVIKVIRNLNVKSLGPQNFIEPFTVNITNDDVLGNLKPDGSITDRLDLKSFKGTIPEDQYILKNFTKLDYKEKVAICEFINHAEDLLIEIDRHFSASSTNHLLKQKAKNILKDLVHDIFLTDTDMESQNQSIQMQKFNKLTIDQLIEILDNILKTMSVSELISEDTEILHQVTNRYCQKITVEIAKSE